MRISTNWLQEWIAVEDDAQTLGDRLTMAGLEVDALEPAAPEFSGVVVAEITACERHPEADRLQLCTVNAGEETFQIVCGAPNARQGLKAPLATVGGVLPGGMKIKRAKLRGVESFGMLCSARELGLSEDAAGLMELPADAPVGQDLREYLALDDMVIEVDLTPNRSDCLGVAGVAREVSALTGKPVQAPSFSAPAPQHQDEIAIQLDAPEACPRYVGQIVRGVNPQAPTPLWMQERLRRAGVRSLGPIVDVTNYVMLELGQPMHAFDLAKIDGGIRVRMATAGEKLELLNGDTVELDNETLVIADHSRAHALAGVMGGECGSVGDATRDILLESAFFSPLAIAGRARRYGLHTDSSHRFERGVDPALQRQAIDRAAQLIVEIAGGAPGPVCEAASDAHLPKPLVVRLRRQRIGHLLGMEIPDERVEAILSALGLTVTAVEEGWDVTVPAFRFDIALEVDLIEELARVWGYDRIPVRRTATPLAIAPQPEGKVALSRLRDTLITRGYQEAITYSFVEPALQAQLDPEQEPLPLANPLSADLAVMRTSLWPGLAKALLYNQNRQHERVRLFETGLRFRGRLDGLAQERLLAGIVAGNQLPEQWAGEVRPVDFFDVKGDLEALFAASGEPESYRFEPETHPALHPGQSARIYRGEQPVGWLGAIHPEVQRELDLAGRSFVFELDLEALTRARVPQFSPLSKFPSIRRDLAVLVDEDVSAAAIEGCVRRAGGELLKDVVLFDVYRGKGVPQGQKSLAMGLILQESSRTLTDQDVDGLIQQVVSRLSLDLGAVLRE
ncbi:phenylalanine--tRNA ligase subunit beta [Alkalilimnicola ehrlichii]|uniref:Phenylalanine--tRNA ligase beta subunit n=2 Tax=Alkalilimnicola ehrlichii TaxID=351052 RepID=A0A3E0WSP8_9GAMM|nr:phenylalanine--tRNA ligase subunit beta [Alkalilimnicola ehrlichii]RFA24409.1 phenylalanine--tRNA ligase subunit beta [Alkalilimnicola ehrlichii]RFA35181.1 phenylalanine--tRNA ligase subunit beta [Alkalilimnicola ehrlichii]